MKDIGQFLELASGALLGAILGAILGAMASAVAADRVVTATIQEKGRASLARPTADPVRVHRSAIRPAAVC